MDILQPLVETPLCKLAYKYGTDKCPRLTHNYTPFYYEMFKHRRASVKKVLEIGIGYKSNKPYKQYPGYQVGGSLMMWRDFFPNAQIYGIDILPSSLIKGERIHTYLCDQANREQLHGLLEKIGTDIDIVVDDGSHLYNHQIFTTKVLLPLLNRDVTYIIEDVLYPGTVTRHLYKFNCIKVSFPSLIVKPYLPHKRNDYLLIVQYQ